MTEQAVQDRLTTPPLGIYVHLPWCVRKCPYCDFNSHARNPGLISESPYLAALEADLRQDLALLGTPRPVHSVFIGGGTPSLFSPEAIGQLLKTLPTREVQLGLVFRLECGYDELVLCQHLLQEVGCQQVVVEYLEQVLVQGECPIDKVEILGRWLNDRSQGRLRPVWLKD